MFLDTDKISLLYLAVQYSAHKERKYSTMAQYRELLNTYRHNCTTEVFG